MKEKRKTYIDYIIDYIINYENYMEVVNIQIVKHLSREVFSNRAQGSETATTKVFMLFASELLTTPSAAQKSRLNRSILSRN